MSYLFIATLYVPYDMSSYMSGLKYECLGPSYIIIFMISVSLFRTHCVEDQCQYVDFDVIWFVSK